MRTTRWPPPVWAPSDVTLPKILEENSGACLLRVTQLTKQKILRLSWNYPSLALAHQATWYIAFEEHHSQNRRSDKPNWSSQVVFPVAIGLETRLVFQPRRCQLTCPNTNFSTTTAGIRRNTFKPQPTYQPWLTPWTSVGFSEWSWAPKSPGENYCVWLQKEKLSSKIILKSPWSWIGRVGMF